MCGVDVSGGCRGGQAVFAVGTDRLCGDTTEKLHAGGLDLLYTEKITGPRIAVYGTAADAQSV